MEAKMKATDIDWKVTEHTGKRQRDMLKGMVLYYAHFGKWSRFSIEEIYQRPSALGDQMPSFYVLRDADRVTDAQVRAGERSPVVSRSVDAQWLLDYALSLERKDQRARAA